MQNAKKRIKSENQKIRTKRTKTNKNKQKRTKRKKQKKKLFSFLLAVPPLGI